MINVLLNIILFIAISQLTTIIHEFGHAMPALFFTGDNVKITLGRDRGKVKKISFWKLDIELKGFEPFTGFAQWNASQITKFHKLIITAGGPVLSLVIGVSLILTSKIIGNHSIKQITIFSGYYNIWQFIITSIPIVYPNWWGGYAGYGSDGYKILGLIKELN